jgi:hypothetical protein
VPNEKRRLRASLTARERKIYVRVISEPEADTPNLGKCRTSAFCLDVKANKICNLALAQ